MGCVALRICEWMGVVRKDIQVSCWVSRLSNWIDSAACIKMNMVAEGNSGLC